MDRFIGIPQEPFAPDASALKSSRTSALPRIIRRIAIAAAAFVILLIAGRWLQERSGALNASFTEPDAAAHYVTSLMIRDYVALGAPTRPMPFAENYYIHYPRVAFGIWPPLYHIVQAAWMLIISDQRSAVLFFNALCAALMAFLLFAALWRQFGFAIALVPALVTVSLPLVQYVTRAVLADAFLTLLIFLATLAYAAYLDHGRRRDAVAFGLLASAAILTKYNGLELALLPLFAFALRPRVEALRRVSFWLPAIIAVVCCAPWYLLNWKLVLYAMERGPDSELPFHSAFTALFGVSIRSLGIPLLMLAAIGAVSRVRSAETRNGLWISAIAVVFSVYIFHTLGYASDDPRYLLGAIPPLLMLATAGAVRVAALWRRRDVRYQRVLAAAILLAAGAMVVFPIARRASSPASSAARFIIAEPQYRDTVILVVSEDGRTEGAVIAEVAMREKRPGHYVARSSKTLAWERIMGNDYRPAFLTSASLMTYLDSVPIGLLVLEPPQGGCHIAHVCQMLEVMRSHPERWRAVANFSRDRPEGDGRQLIIYEMVGNIPRPLHKLSVDMKATLQRDISTE
jgi:hypothetical protein